MKDDTSFYPLLVELATCLCAELESAGLPTPCYCGVLPGQVVPLDYCGECGERCGMAWVRLATIGEELSLTGEQVRRTSRCAVPLQATVEVGVARCAPSPDDLGNPPSEAAQLAATQLQMADMAAALRAITCCSVADYALGTWTPAGPEGGCLGGSWLVTFPGQ